MSDECLQEIALAQSIKSKKGKCLHKELVEEDY